MMMPAGPCLTLTWLVVLALVVGGTVLLVRAVGDRGERGPTGSTALGLLEERYARGEIDREEFEERRRVLGS
jgi:putative membrane protein